MPSGKITKTSVDGLGPATGQSGASAGKAVPGYLWDTELKGFGVKALPSGRKVYIIQYRLNGEDGDTQRVTLGTHGNITADEARIRAKKALGQIADKVDIADERRKAKVELQQAPTVADIGKRYIEAEAAAKTKASTLKRYRWLHAKVITPGLGKKLIRDVIRGDVKSWHADLASTPTQANRALALLSWIFNRAIDDGYKPDRVNPCEGVKPFKEQARKRYLTEKEIGALGDALDQAVTTGAPWSLADDLPPEKAKHRPKRDENLRTRIDPHAAAAIRLILLTGARLGEILSLRWEHVDLDAGLLRLPDSKTGSKDIVLNGYAKDVLANLPRSKDQPFVIPGEDKTDAKTGETVKTHRADNLKRPWNMVRRMAGLGDLRIHDLRHSHAAVAVSFNVSLRLIGGLLGHASEKTTARYGHLSDSPLRDASEKVGKHIADALGGKNRAAPETNADVVPIPVAKRK